jgi:pimeloyl-ACP methyl ester carboxylesterase
MKAKRAKAAAAAVSIVEVESEPAASGRRDLFYTSSDGLRLHVADYGDAISPWLPVVCIPGLSRNARDFHDLAVHLSTHRHRPRRVVVFDLRGRGGSVASSPC